MKSRILFFVLIFSQNIGAMGWFSNKKSCCGNSNSSHIRWEHTQEDLLSVPQCSDSNSNKCKQTLSEIYAFKKAFENTHVQYSDDVCSVKKIKGFLTQDFFKEVTKEAFENNKNVLPSEREMVMNWMFQHGCSIIPPANDYIKNYLIYCRKNEVKDLSFKDYLKKNLGFLISREKLLR